MEKLNNVRRELSKVSWLSKKEVFNQFILVHIVGGVFITYFFVIDIVVNFVKRLFN